VVGDVAGEFDGACGPVGHPLGEFFEEVEGALAAAVGDGRGDIAARCDRLGERGRTPAPQTGGEDALVAGQGPVADEVAEVRQHPGGRRLDEQVLVALLDSIAYEVELLGHDGEQGAQRFALLGVAQPVPLGQQLGESVRFPGHHTASVSNWVSRDIT
jgi:hypothetical protein